MSAITDMQRDLKDFIDSRPTAEIIRFPNMKQPCDVEDEYQERKKDVGYEG